jgi:hypothetical protein
MDQPLGYCTNVHAGADLQTTRQNLQQHALGVKQIVSPEAPMGIGLWLSASAAAKLRQDEQFDDFRDWLTESGLIPYTMNGFPFGDFHQEIVKHDVYQPTWSEPARQAYTADLINLLDRLLPAEQEATISTLPICWGTPAPAEAALQQAAQYLLELAEQLRQLEEESGRCISICLEPEPGCYLDRSEDIVNFFQSYLLPAGDEETTRRYLRVCHDVCHAAVMFEPQADVLNRYVNAGLQVGKVQVSSAVILPREVTSSSQLAPALEQLAGFAEDRYLHQTVVQSSDGSTTRFYEDLHIALDEIDLSQAAGTEWRVHFHVPIYLETFAHLHTSRADVEACLATCQQLDLKTSFEVETYAWGVLPAELQVPELATGIARELQWFKQLMQG